MTYHAATGDSRRGAVRSDGTRRPFPRVDERCRAAAVGEVGVERGEILQPQPDAAERNGKRRLRARRQHRLQPDAAQPAIEARRPDLRQHLHRRDVERQAERLADRHGAAELVVEVLRMIGAEPRRAILDQRLRVRAPCFERETVDDRLQRRARRTDRLHHVHGTEPIGVEIIRRTDVRENTARGVISDEHRARQARTLDVRVLAGERFERGLDIAIERQAMNALARQPRHLGFGEMGRELAELATHARHRLGDGAARFLGRNDARCRRTCEHPIAGTLGIARIAIGTARTRTLR